MACFVSGLRASSTPAITVRSKPCDSVACFVLRRAKKPSPPSKAVSSTLIIGAEGVGFRLAFKDCALVNELTSAGFTVVTVLVTKRVTSDGPVRVMKFVR